MEEERWGNTSHKSMVGLVDHLRAIHVYHKYKMELDPKNTKVGQVLESLAIREIC